MNSDQLFELSKKYVPGGVHSPVRSFKGLHCTPRFIKSADKALITDEEDKTYIDFCMSFGPMILGHRDPDVEEDVKVALTRGWSYGACEKYSLDLAQYIVDRIPHIEQIRFVNSGTEAVMTAIRIARGYTGKSKIIKFNGCYHGHTDAMLIKAGSGLAGTATASSAGVSEQVAHDTLVFDLGDLEAVTAAFKEHSDIAAIFIEPLPANNGLLIQSKEFIQGLRKLCDEHNSLLIFDEVISGFRVGFEGMAKDLDIRPDMVTYGKIIGGGFPVGAIASNTDIMSSLAPVGNVYQAGTLSANPVAMTAGLSTLKKLTPAFYESLEFTSNKVVKLMSEWCAQNGYSDYRVIQYKSLFWAVPTAETISKASAIPDNISERFFHLFQTLLNKGIYLAPNAYEVGFISAAHEQSLDELKQRLWS